MASQRQPSDFGDTVVLEPNVSLLLKRARSMSDAVKSKEKEVSFYDVKLVPHTFFCVVCVSSPCRVLAYKVICATSI